MRHIYSDDRLRLAARLYYVDRLDELAQVRVIHDHVSRANLAIVAVGTLENSVFVERGVLSGDDIAELRRAGAIGEVCGRFIDAAGKECASPWRDRVMSAQIEQLRRIPHVIGADALLATATSTRPAKARRSKK